MNRKELALYMFRCAEAIYRKPGQPVMTEAEILKEMPMETKTWVEGDKEYTVNFGRILNNGKPIQLSSVMRLG